MAGPTTVTTHAGYGRIEVYHANQWEADVDLCLCRGVDASGKRLVGSSRGRTQRDKRKEYCTNKGQVTIVAQLLEAGVIQPVAPPAPE